MKETLTLGVELLQTIEKLFARGVGVFDIHVDHILVTNIGK